jgi:hypothetical protein
VTSDAERAGWRKSRWCCAATIRPSWLSESGWISQCDQVTARDLVRFESQLVSSATRRWKSAGKNRSSRPMSTFLGTPGQLVKSHGCATAAEGPRLAGQQLRLRVVCEVVQEMAIEVELGIATCREVGLAAGDSRAGAVPPSRPATRRAAGRRSRFPAGQISARFRGRARLVEGSSSRVLSLAAGAIFAEPERSTGEEREVTMLRRVSAMNVWADDLPAPTRWYTELLGVEPYFIREAAGRGPGYVEFRIGDYHHELGIVDRRFAPPGLAAGPGGAVVYWHVDDVGATLERLVSLGPSNWRRSPSAAPGSSLRRSSTPSATFWASCRTAITSTS